MQPIEELEEDLSDYTSSRDKKLVSWVMDKIRPWADHRDSEHKDRWEEYNRLWRGIWSSEDKTRNSERSKLISPATAQAIEVACAEIEEAVFGKGRWFDVKDDHADENPQDVEMFRNLMLEDLNEAGVPNAMSEIFLNGCIYGTGIGKIVIEEEEVKSFTGEDSGYPNETKVVVKLIPVQLDEFVIDPAARSIEESLGVGHEMMLPRHIVTQKQESGVYNDVSIGSYTDDMNLVSDQSVYGESVGKSSSASDEVKITEWHGLVPLSLIDPSLDEDEEFEDLGITDEQIEDSNLVEAIVTIVNDSTLLRVTQSPYTMKDRCFIAYQHDTIPNQFWGRGITEKGYNSQKALDAEIRGRMDAMALAIHPMMAMDATRIPRGSDLSVRAGRTILTNGDPRTVLMPLNFGQVGSNTFQQSGDLERMIQMATGAMDSAAPMSSNAALSTASGMSMMMSGAIKRSKRTMANIERNFIKPLIEKAAWRYMQFSPERYPSKDYKFIPMGSLGIMAREIETQQLTSLLQTVEQGSTAFWMLLGNIYENSSISNRDEMIAYARDNMQKSMNPSPNPEIEMKQQETQYKMQLDKAKLQIEGSRAQTEAKRVEIEAAKAPASIKKTEQEGVYSLERAKSEQIESNLAIREQDMKEKEVDLKERQMLIDSEIDRLKLEQDERQAIQVSNQPVIEPVKQEAPVININGSSKKKITVTRTKNGLEGISEEI